ncbi:MAG TPA: MFS transporter, partial [Ktedonobacteraceae bacterium]|nr:MFS transporter [Ktedonobacteraceae bacterium]
YSTLMVPFEASRGLNFTEMFSLESIISLFSWIFDIPTGIWADRVGYRSVLTVGYGLNVASLLVFLLAHTFWMFALASALFGIGLACISGAESALVYESLPREDGVVTRATAAFSLLHAATPAGFLLGLSFGSFLGAYSLLLPFIASLLPLSIAFLVTFRLQPIAHQRQAGQSRPTLSLKHGMDILRSALTILREQPTAVGLSLLQSAAFALIDSIFWYNQPYFTRAGIPVMWFGPITAVAVGLGMGIALTTPGAKRRLGTSNALALSCLVPAIGYMVLSLTHLPVLTALCVALVAAGPAWRSPIIIDELNRRIKDGPRATTLSVLSALGTLMGITLNPLIGRAGDLGLSLTGLCLGGGLAVLGLLVKALL